MAMKRTMIAGLGCWLVWTASAAAQATLTWQDCVQEALAHHPDLAAKQQAVRQAEAGVTTARSSLLPQLSTEAGARWSGSNTSSLGRSVNYGLSLQQLLFDGFQSLRSLDQASTERLAAQLNYTDKSADVRQQLRKAYVELLRSQAALDMTRGIVRRRKDNLELVRLRYEAGREHRGSLLQAQAQFSQAQADARQAERNLVQAQYELDRELGRTEYAAVSVAGEFDFKPAEAKPDFSTLVKQNAQWRILAAQTESARLGLAAAEGAWYPSLNASASAGRSGDLPPDQSSVSAGLSLSWPLFNGGKRTGTIERSRAVYEQTRALETSGRDQLLVALVNAWAGYQDAADAVEVQRQFLAAAAERSRISESQYSTGLLGFDDWTIIEDDYVSAQKAYLNAQALALSEEAGWVRAQGGTLENER